MQINHPTFATVTEFENRIAEFFGSPYAVAVDSATHGIELCLRLRMQNDSIAMYIPKRTYLSVPMLANKLNIPLYWIDYSWTEFYRVCGNIIDAAVLWRRNSYLPGTFMSISFQYQKHLSLARGGMILCDNKEAADELRKMSYDGRVPGIPWREQGDITTQGFHYYMTPDTAALGLQKLDEAIRTPPRQWTIQDWPDISNYSVFKNKL